MPYKVTEYVQTPNPNALKCVLDASPTGARGMRSYSRSRDDAAPDQADALGVALMAIPEIESVLIHDGWITVVKSPKAGWGGVKRAVAGVLAAAPAAAEAGAP